MPSYQIVFIVRTGSDAERTKSVDFVKGLLKGLKVTKEEDLGSKALAYKIKGQLQGHYYELHVEGAMPMDFERKIMENDVILRQLVLRK